MDPVRSGGESPHLASQAARRRPSAHLVGTLMRRIGMTGTRDLACTELWERSLERSLRRRRLAQSPRPAAHKVSVAALAATLATPTTAGAALLRTHSRGTAVSAAQRALG